MTNEVRGEKMRKYNTVILDRAKLMEGIHAYCKRNGVSVTGVAKRCGLSYKFESNGKITYKRKHPDGEQDFIEVTEDTYRQICTAYLLTPERYVVREDAAAQKTEQPQKQNGMTTVAYLRMLNERLMELEKVQQEQNEILKRLLAVWGKT